MKEKIKKPYRIYFLYSIIIIFIISFVIFEGIFFQNNAFAIDFGLSGLKYTPNCVPLNEPDPETGCRVCGKTGDDSVKIAYEQCRQTYFLKKQMEILASQQASQETLSEKERVIQGLQELSERQNNQIGELIQRLEEQNQRINILTTSLQKTNSLNIGLSIILVVIVFFLTLTFVRKRWKK